MTSTVVNRHRRRRVSGRDLVKVADLTLKALGRGRMRVNIVLVSDRSIRTLNRKYHHNDRATDCLAFGYEGDKSLLGDVVISLDRARVQARMWGEPFRREVWRYAVHGILHLLGYRDDTARARSRMFHKQEEILLKAARTIGKKR